MSSMKIILCKILPYGGLHYSTSAAAADVIQTFHSMTLSRNVLAAYATMWFSIWWGPA